MDLNNFHQLYYKISTYSPIILFDLPFFLSTKDLTKL